MSTIKASDIINLAISYIGVRESPANSNNVQFNTDFYGRQVSGGDFPWCCAFIWDLFRMLDASDLFLGGLKTAWCPNVEYYAKRHGQWVTENYQTGDCALFNFQGGTLAGHIGIAESVNDDGMVNTIEGNTAVTCDDNGGEVMRRTRNTSVILGAYRPNYESEDDTMTGEEIYNALKEYTDTAEAPDWAKDELSEAVAAGITDGTRPMELIPRYQAAIMAKRAAGK